MNLKTLLLKKKGRFRSEYYAREIDIPKGCIPGEWVFLTHEENKDKKIAMVNSYISDGAPVRVIDLDYQEGASEEEIALKMIKKGISDAVNKRKDWKLLKDGHRLIYGNKDGLPGLIADLYQNICLVQINTLGMDRFRESIRLQLESLIELPVAFLDNSEQRKDEGIPEASEKNDDISDISIKENDLMFTVPKSVLQKVGYYYDHRINRRKLQQWIKELPNPPKKGADLFCYVGSWGLNALKAGVDQVDFVDQGRFDDAIKENLKLNNFEKKGVFYRSDVMKWLDGCRIEGRKYDLIISDPPAFSKSFKNKARALGGYEKLHHKISRILAPNSLFVAASCTQGISLNELDRSVQNAFEERSIQLLDIGLQGPDHPMRGYDDSSNYIKFLIYKVD